MQEQTYRPVDIEAEHALFASRLNEAVVSALSDAHKEAIAAHPTERQQDALGAVAAIGADATELSHGDELRLHESSLNRLDTPATLTVPELYIDPRFNTALEIGEDLDRVRTSAKRGDFELAA